MPVGYPSHSGEPEHASAVRRLAGAREEQARLDAMYAEVAGTQAEPFAQERLSAGRAYVASREEWLHWVEAGKSLAPWADGEWAPEPPAELPVPAGGPAPGNQSRRFSKPAPSGDRDGTRTKA
jgi:hypothetical protein